MTEKDLQISDRGSLISRLCRLPCGKALPFRPVPRILRLRRLRHSLNNFLCHGKPEAFRREGGKAGMKESGGATINRRQLACGFHCPLRCGLFFDLMEFLIRIRTPY